MTGEEWDELRWFETAYAELDPQLHDRKLRLLVCACVRGSWWYFPDPSERAVIECSEQYADDPSQYSSLRYAVNEMVSKHSADLNSIFLDAAVTHSASYRDSGRQYLSATYGLIDHLTRRRGPHATKQDEAECRWKIQYTFLQMLRDIFGNPFRPVAFDPVWRTSTAVGVAQQVYDARDFAAMPILADALQDAGCEDTTILNHCRDPQQVHVRGCWVVDLVLGKS